jgi:hypothetical protein
VPARAGDYSALGNQLLERPPGGHLGNSVLLSQVRDGRKLHARLELFRFDAAPKVIGDLHRWGSRVVRLHSPHSPRLRASR